MGQQQLLLLVLGIVIVGVAVVVGISMLSENKEKAEFDAITSEAIRIAADAVAWKAKPTSFGGGASVKYLTGLTFDKLGYNANKKGNASHTTTYWRNVAAVSSKRPYVMVRPKSAPNIRVQLFLYGPTADCFKLRRGRKIDGKWKNAKMKVGKNAKPSGCSQW